MTHRCRWTRTDRVALAQPIKKASKLLCLITNSVAAIQGLLRKLHRLRVTAQALQHLRAQQRRTRNLVVACRRPRRVQVRESASCEASYQRARCPPAVQGDRTAATGVLASLAPEKPRVEVRPPDFRVLSQPRIPDRPPGRRPLVPPLWIAAQQDARIEVSLEDLVALTDAHQLVQFPGVSLTALPLQPVKAGHHRSRRGAHTELVAGRQITQLCPPLPPEGREVANAKVQQQCIAAFVQSWNLLLFCQAALLSSANSCLPEQMIVGVPCASRAIGGPGLARLDLWSNLPHADRQAAYCMLDTDSAFAILIGDKPSAEPQLPTEECSSGFGVPRNQAHVLPEDPNRA
mmetsp:Transcript_109108/g.348309  ORF Transcript_109108/g.348309 Transcript_109108/m.348309 type:complete len:347 (-) Transcript_109108:880-1920(-)